MKFLPRWILPCALGLCALGYWVRKEATVEDAIAAAVRDVNREETWGIRLHGAVWKRLPKIFTEMAPGLAPADPGRIRISALERLGTLAPQSELAVATLLEVLKGKRPVREHLSAIGALGRIGPFAGPAIDPLLGIIATCTNVMNPFSDEVRSACFSALTAIAPADERVLNALLGPIEGKTDRFSTVGFLERSAALYDEKVRARLVELMRRDPESKPGLVRVAGKIQPESARTISILLECLREGNTQAKAAVVSLLLQQPIRRMEIARELNNLLMELRAENPPTVPAPAPPSIVGRSVQVNEAWLNRQRLTEWNNLRRNTISALAKMGPIAGESVSLLHAHLSHPDREVRSKSAMALFRITGDFGAAGKLYGEMLKDDAASIRKFAVVELAQLSPESPAGIPYLIGALKDPNNQVRGNAAAGLGAAGTNALAALPYLMSLTNDPSPAVRYDATNAIARIRAASTEFDR
jgi:HEAT repeat protein